MPATVALPPMRLTQREFDSLPEYSFTLPSGTVTGKRWKADRNWHRKFSWIDGPDWVIGEYGEITDDEIKIHWYKPYILNETEQLIRRRLFGSKA